MLIYLSKTRKIRSIPLLDLTHLYITPAAWSEFGATMARGGNGAAMAENPLYGTVVVHNVACEGK